MESSYNYVYKSSHLEVMGRKKEWFQRMCDLRTGKVKQKVSGRFRQEHLHGNLVNARFRVFLKTIGEYFE
ncbi:DUF3291 domain-containing protein [Pleurocapsa sp. PCC 7319]|uniref:DUF3291 domain-containing protein n=1 Tax=Pleurocapsa sp. PCC 7319 TaxID=118161 RepID=UPI0009FE41FD|nr:DUF3291 domain-containing protein [Pleurocapsa sp. PCC 7319]